MRFRARPACGVDDRDLQSDESIKVGVMVVVEGWGNCLELQEGIGDHQSVLS